MMAAENLENFNVSATVINARYIKPLDAECIIRHTGRTGRVITIEENVLCGGFGSAVLELLQSTGLNDVQVCCLGIPDLFLEHGSQPLLREKYGLSPQSITDSALEMIKPHKKRSVRLIKMGGGT